MGRPPLGKQAMSSTERQRRYWERVLGAEAPQAKKCEAALQAELTEAKRRIAALQAKLDKAKKPRTEGELQRQLKAARTEISNLKAQVRVLGAQFDRAHRGQIMTRALHREIRACLHPDRVADPDLKRRYHKAFVAFDALKFKFKD